MTFKTLASSNFMYGVQKSGTTWLRNIVGVGGIVSTTAEMHLPRLACAIETHLSHFSLLSPRELVPVVDQAVRTSWQDLAEQFLYGVGTDKSAYPCLRDYHQRELEPFAQAIKRYYFPLSRCVMILRDPRDVFVSSKHFFSATSSIDEAHDFAIRWAVSNLAWLKSQPDLVVRYEELKLDFDTAVSKVYQTLNLDLPWSLLDEIRAQYFSIRLSHEKHPNFYRRGDIGSWRDELDPEVADAIWKAAAPAMSHFGYQQNGDVGDIKESEFLSSFDEVPLDTILRGGCDKARVIRRGSQLDFVINDDGFFGRLDAVFIPAVGPGNRLLIILEVSWAEFGKQGLRFAIVSSGATRYVMSEAARPFDRARRYKETTFVSLELTSEQCRDLAIVGHCDILLFNGEIKKPFLASLHRLMMGVVTEDSPIRRLIDVSIT